MKKLQTEQSDAVNSSIINWVEKCWYDKTYLSDHQHIEATSLNGQL